MEKRSLVLVAGIGRGPFEALAPVLDRQKLEVVKVAAPEMSIELARSEQFDLIIFDADVREGSLGQVVDEIRRGCRPAATARCWFWRDPAVWIRPAN